MAAAVEQEDGIEQGDTFAAADVEPSTVISDKEKALGGTASSFGAFPYVIAGLERENKALKDRIKELVDKYETRFLVKVKDTRCREDNPLVLDVTFEGGRSCFHIPNDIDIKETGWTINEDDNLEIGDDVIEAFHEDTFRDTNQHILRKPLPCETN